MATNWLVVLKTYVDTLETIVGTEGGIALANKLTAARAALLDEITAARMAELDAANMPADLDTIKGYTDTLEAAIGAIEGATTLHNKLTAARAALLDQITAARMAELDPANMPGDIDLIKGYTDSLEGAIGAIEGATTLHNKLTAARAALLDRLSIIAAGGAGELTAARAGYLDNINQAGLLQATAARMGYLDKLPNFQHEVEWSSTPVVEQVASLNATDLTAGTIVPTFPSGATRVRAILVANIHSANFSAATHHITLKVQGKKDAGAYGDLIDLTAQTSIGLVNLDGAGDGLCVSVDVTALVDASASTYLFKFIVDSDNAGAVNYTSSFVLVLVYKI